MSASSSGSRRVCLPIHEVIPYISLRCQGQVRNRLDQKQGKRHSLPTMAGLARAVVIGFPYHITRRANRCEDIFSLAESGIRGQ